MSRQDRLFTLVDRGMELLEAGDLDGAARQLDMARRIDPKHADVLRLDAGLATAEGDIERAMSLFEQVAEADPEDATPWISVAHILLYSQAEPEAALAKITKALELVDDEQALVDAILIKVDTLLALERIDEAKETLSELSTSAIDDAALAITVGDAYLACGDGKAALTWLEKAKADPELATDALHAIGCAHEQLENKDEQVRAFLEVRRRDLAAPWPEWHLDHDEFEAIAAAAIEELPPRAKELLKDVPILVDDVPAEGVVADGFDPRAFGMIDGPNLREQSVDGRGARPVNIFLYQKNLEQAFSEPDELAEQIRITVLHETAHYFGLDEDELEGIGLD
jgi:predicted Zn-dependent protease with MMP-like domain/thioredoxin-like negative regulator of GroEL